MAELPSVESATAPGDVFEHHLQEGNIFLQRCANCGMQVFFPRVLCPSCGGTDLAWEQIDGRGVVYSTTVVRRRPDRGGDYNVCVVELRGGARMMSRVEEIEPAAVAIGQEVVARIVQEGERPLITFIMDSEER